MRTIPTEHLRALADLSIQRGCGFCLLAIVTVAVGLIFKPILAVQASAILLTMLAVALAYKGVNAPQRRYRDTELWLLLNERPDLPEARLQQVIGGLLHDRYLWHAKLACWIAGFFWVFWLLLFALS
jgi:hypothetical protein